MPVTRLYVIKLSGSLFFSASFSKVASGLSEVVRAHPELRLVLVAGGGAGARKYIEVAQKLGADQTTQDEIGIAVSRLNASVLIAALGEAAFPTVPTTLSEVVTAVRLGDGAVARRIVVVGGLHPGQSTNAVGALLAEKLHARMFFNATDVDGVYTADPRKSKKAKLLAAVSTKALASLLGGEAMKAGGYDLMDPVALKLIERSKIPTTILKCDAALLKRAILKGGNAKVGTRILVDS